MSDTGTRIRRPRRAVLAGGALAAVAAACWLGAFAVHGDDGDTRPAVHATATNPPDDAPSPCDCDNPNPGRTPGR